MSVGSSQSDRRFPGDADARGGEPGGRGVEIDGEGDRVQGAAPVATRRATRSTSSCGAITRRVRSPMAKSAIVSGPSPATASRLGAEHLMQQRGHRLQVDDDRGDVRDARHLHEAVATAGGGDPVAGVAGEAVVGELEHEPERVARVHEEVAAFDVHAGDPDAGLLEVVLRGPHVGDLPRQRLHAGAVLRQPAADDARRGRRTPSARKGTSPIHTIPMSLPSRSSWIGLDHHPGAEHAPPLVDCAVDIVDGQGDAMAVAGVTEAARSRGHGVRSPGQSTVRKVMVAALMARSPLPSSWRVSWTPTRPRASRPRERAAVDPEGPDFASRQEHEVIGLGLELVGAGELGGEVDRRRLVDDELRTDVERGIG